MSWIQVHQRQETREAAPPNSTEYVVITEVQNAGGIEAELFVHLILDDSFAYVATYNDLKIYPNNKAAAEAQGLGFYRASRSEQALGNQGLAVKASAHTLRRLQLVNKDWGSVNQGSFGGDTVVVYDSEETT